MNIVVVGSANADYFIKTPRLPKPGETIQATIPEPVRSGGKGANTAAAASKILAENPNAKVYFIGKFGREAEGDMLMEDLRKFGCDLTYCEVIENMSSGKGFCFILDGGQSSIVIVSGTNFYWPIGLSQEMINCISTCQVLLLQREVPEEINIQASKLIKGRKDAFTLIDLGGVSDPMQQELMENLDVISPNETEFERILQIQSVNFKDFQSIDKLFAEFFVSKGIYNILLKLGENGSYFIGHENENNKLLTGSSGNIFKHHQPAFKIQNVVDGTGAGDCFTGCFIAEVLNLKISISNAAEINNNFDKIKQAMVFASASGGICVSRPGAMPSLPSKEEVLELIAKGSM